MMPDPVRFASVGLGWWGKTLAEGALRAGAGSPVSCYSRNAEARDDFASTFGCDAAASLDELLADDRVEALFVATPHSTHAAVMLAAFEAGKHVFVEKPLTVSVEEGRRCVRAADGAGLVLQVGHHRRRQAANRRIKAMIDAGELGVIEQVEAQHSGPSVFAWPESSWRRDRKEMPAGATTVMGCHMLDTMQYFLGRPSRLAAISKRIVAAAEVDDATGYLIEFESGPIGYLGTSVAIPWQTTIAVYGTDAAVWNHDDGARLILQRRDERERHDVPVEQNDPIADELAEFARCIREGGAPETDGRAALEVVRMIEAAVESAERGVFVELGPVAAL
jgi:predicted dehydrogenase